MRAHPPSPVARHRTARRTAGRSRGDLAFEAGDVDPHPGGTLRAILIGGDYADLRRRLFGFDLAPLPGSLALSAADEESNRRAKLVMA